MKSSKTKGKKEERLTDRDFRELMGMYRPIHKRVKGRVRRK